MQITSKNIVGIKKMQCAGVKKWHKQEKVSNRAGNRLQIYFASGGNILPLQRRTSRWTGESHSTAPTGEDKDFSCEAFL